MKRASVVALFDPSDAVLFLLRSPQSKIQGWCLPGGNCEGEPPSVTAIREVREETGIEIDVEGDLFYCGASMSLMHKKVFVYRYRINEFLPKITLSNEHVDWAWTSAFHKIEMAGKTHEFVLMAQRSVEKNGWSG